MLIPDRFTWYLTNLPMHIVCWSPFINGFASLCFMKAYRSILFGTTGNQRWSVSVTNQQQLQRRNSHRSPYAQTQLESRF